MFKLFDKTFFRQALWFLVILCLCFVLLIALARYNEAIGQSALGAMVFKATSSIGALFGE